MKYISVPSCFDIKLVFTRYLLLGLLQKNNIEKNFQFHDKISDKKALDDTSNFSFFPSLATNLKPKDI